MGDSAAGKWDRGYSRLGVRLGRNSANVGMVGKFSGGEREVGRTAMRVPRTIRKCEGESGEDDSAGFRTIINCVWGGGKMDLVRPKSGEGGCERVVEVEGNQHSDGQGDDISRGQSSTAGRDGRIAEWVDEMGDLGDCGGV